jgi:hypothetical protein
MHLHFRLRRIIVVVLIQRKALTLGSLLTSSVFVLFLQEHWLSSNQLITLLGEIDAITSFIPKRRNPIIWTGRPYGGCAILRSDLYVKLMYCQLTVRECMRYTYDQRRFQINRPTYCVYVPYEGDKVRTDNFADQLLTMEDLVNKNNDCVAVVGCDFNVDLFLKR